jgi:undecaprenyl-diphosphatase
MLGLTREKAFRFSFLLSIPAIVGALGLVASKEHETLMQAGIGGSEILVGVTIAMIAGYFALRLLRKAIESRKFYLFALYCWLLGTALLMLSLFRV